LLTAGSGAAEAADSKQPPPVSQTPDKEPIKIGFVGTLSGSLVDEGAAEMENGLRMFFEQSHYQIAGRKIDLIVEDDANSIATCREKVHKLIDRDHVNILCGFLRPGFGVGPDLEKYQTPVVVAVCVDDDLTQRKHSRWLIRTGMTASQTTFPLGEWAYKVKGWRRVATIAPDFPLSYQSVGGFQKTFEEAGGKVVQKVWTPLSANDFTAHIKLLRKDVDAVFVSSLTGSNRTFDRQIRQLMPNTQLIGFGAYCDEPVMRELGSTMVGSYFIYPYARGIDTPTNKKFVSAYEKKYGRGPAFFAQACYVCGMFIGKAIESLNGQVDDKEKLLAALKSVKLDDSPRGPVKLDSYANPIENMYIFRVEPAKSAPGGAMGVIVQKYADVSQFWKYNPEEYQKQPPFSKDYPPCRYCGDTDTARH
jgi:branched-chain amino acid transport system substrate-binding protein